MPSVPGGGAEFEKLKWTFTERIRLFGGVDTQCAPPVGRAGPCVKQGSTENSFTDIGNYAERVKRWCRSEWIRARKRHRGDVRGIWRLVRLLAAIGGYRQLLAAIAGT